MSKNTFNVDEQGLVLTRVVDAPRELVFKVWSEADHLKNWWGPAGFEMDVATLEFRPGGKFHYKMESPEGFVMWGLFVFGEIIEPEKIVFVNSFSDQEGNMVRAPFFEVWPLEIQNTLTLEENDGKTTITLKGFPINATDEEVAAFIANKDSMQQGFTGTFDQLDAYLAKTSL